CSGGWGLHAASDSIPTRRSSDLAGIGATGAVFRQVATGLTHHPHGRDVYGLLEQGTKETVVLEGSHVGIRKKSAGIFSERDAKRSEEHTSELQSREKLVCRLRLE